MFLVGFVFVFDVQSGFVAQPSFDLLGSSDPSVFASQIPRALDARHCTYCIVFCFNRQVLSSTTFLDWCGFEKLVSGDEGVPELPQQNLKLDFSF